jgi:hypothetical protein
VQTAQGSQKSHSRVGARTISFDVDGEAVSGRDLHEFIKKILLQSCPGIDRPHQRNEQSKKCPQLNTIEMRGQLREQVGGNHEVRGSDVAFCSPFEKGVFPGKSHGLISEESVQPLQDRLSCIVIGLLLCS